MRLLILLMLAFAAIFWFIVRPYWQRETRRALLRTQLNADEREIILHALPLIASLPPELLGKLEGLINLFLHQKRFTGYEGLVVTDEMKLTIAAQACMLLLGSDDDQTFRNLTNIYLYPDGFTSRQQRRDGSIVHEHSTARSGESWTLGPVVLSWRDAQSGGANPHDARNVVYHEFAHQLDQETGEADGFPKLHGIKSWDVWAEILGQEYRALLSAVDQNQSTFLDKYGATNPAEFFAVATESFFEKPRQLKQQHEALYEQLADFYGLNMALLEF